MTVKIKDETMFRHASNEEIGQEIKRRGLRFIVVDMNNLGQFYSTTRRVYKYRGGYRVRINSHWYKVIGFIQRFLDDEPEPSLTFFYVNPNPLKQYKRLV